MRVLFAIVALVIFLIPSLLTDIKTASLSVYPKEPLQGEPVLITVDAPRENAVQNVRVGATVVPTFLLRGKISALQGIGLDVATGTQHVVVTLTDGEQLSEDFVVIERLRVVEKLGIPQKLGGDTRKSQAELVSSLGEENKILADIPTAPQALWSERFVFPLSSTSVTGAYGYTRMTGTHSIPHKGVDFRAATGTPVLAVNRGVVRLAHEFRVYGKTLVLDHGLGLQTLYMHLSDFLVSSGQSVEKGETIAFSGDTGYAEFPHLHVSVRIAGISVDPLAFLKLLGASAVY